MGSRRSEMGRKPGEREVKVAARTALGFESTVPCGCCGAPSRRVRQQWRACANGHKFLKKSDQR
jgi:hypothetical protein